MKAAQFTTATTPAKRNTLFFKKGREQDFFRSAFIGSQLNQAPSFFTQAYNRPGIQTKYQGEQKVDKAGNNSLVINGTHQGITATGTGDELAPVSKAGECTPGRSESNCFDGAGYIITKIDNDCCTRPCTVEHESIHVRDLDACCRAYHRARKADGADEATVTATYQKWRDVARKVSECRAYSNDITCAQRLAIEKGCIPEPERKEKSTEVAVNSDEVSGISESVPNDFSEEATAQESDPGTELSGGLKEQSGCCKDIVSYSEMFAPEAKAWCGEAAGRSIPPCPFKKP